MNKRNKILVVLLSLIVFVLIVMTLSNIVIEVANEGSFRGIIYNYTSGDKRKIFRYVPTYNGVSDYNAITSTYDLSYFAANGRNDGGLNLRQDNYFLQIILEESMLIMFERIRMNYVNSQSTATKFVTNSSGQIKIKNLEINFVHFHFLCLLILNFNKK